MPYRTMDNFINGAVLTFTKITPVKALENKLSTLAAYAQSQVNNMEDAAMILDEERKVLVTNQHFLSLFQLRDFEVKEHFFMEIVHNKWNTNKLDGLLFKDEDATTLYLQHDFPGLSVKKLAINITYVSKERLALIITFKQQESG